MTVNIAIFRTITNALLHVLYLGRVNGLLRKLLLLKKERRNSSAEMWGQTYK